MPPRLLLHRVLAQAEQLFHTIRPGVLSPAAPPRSAVASTAGSTCPAQPTAPVTLPDGPAGPTPVATTAVPASETELCTDVSPLSEEPTDPHHR